MTKTKLKIIKIKKIFIFALLFVVGNVFAQDILVLRDGTIKEVKVLEISDTEIRYKNWNNQQGVTFATALSNVLSVKYENGEEQKFQTIVSHRQTSANNKNPNKGFSVHLGAAIPTGEFADGVGVGANLGVKYIFNLTDGLGLFLGADGMINFASDDAKELCDDAAGYYINYTGVAEVDVTYPKFISVPVTLGLNYRHDVTDKFGVWGEAGAGPNMRFIMGENLLPVMAIR